MLLQKDIITFALKYFYNDASRYTIYQFKQKIPFAG